MTILSTWAARWRIPATALIDLQQQMGLLDPAPALTREGRSEAAISNAVRIEASKRGMRLWRNNVGQLNDVNGRPVRYGLCNDSPALNRVLKSGDLIGIDPVRITREHEGSVIGQFVSFETKQEDWHFTGTPREEAQQRWAELVISLGGRARFVNREGQI